MVPGAPQQGRLLGWADELVDESRGKAMAHGQGMKGLRIGPVACERNTLLEAGSDLGGRIAAERDHEDRDPGVGRQYVGRLLNEYARLAGTRARDDRAMTWVLDHGSLFGVEFQGNGQRAFGR